MKQLQIMVLLCVAGCVLGAATKAKDFYNPHDEGDQVILLTQHFIKLNTILNATESLTQGLLNLNQRLDDLNKRQEAILNKMENLQQSLLNLTQRQEVHESRVKASLENFSHNLIERQDAILNKSETLEHSLWNLTQRQGTQENRIVSQSRTWQTILRRQDGSVDFNRNWTEYQNGFGDPNGEIFIGLDKLHEMTTTYGPTQELLVILKDFEGESRYAKYDSFRVGNEAEKYALVELGKYSGDAGNSLIGHKGYKFSTPDQDNDPKDDGNCAKGFQSGWWFRKCYVCNLNGLYRKEAESNRDGVSWNEWKGVEHSLKFAEMKIRSRF